MDLSGSKAFYTSTDAVACGGQIGVEMSADEVSRRRQLLFYLLKQKTRVPQDSRQPLLLRQEWRVEFFDQDVFVFS